MRLHPDPPSLRFTLRRAHVDLNFITVPLLSVLVLLVSGAINATVVRNGIVGADGVQPLDIMALFMSLAYLSISLDATGLLRFLAFWVARTGGSSGQRLYAYFYAFFLLCGVIVENDPVILSGTVFLAYFTRVSGITPLTAWIFAQFAAANMASVVLVSSNPTNLVLSGAFSLKFTTYTIHCILPFLAAAVLVYPVLVLVLFRSPVLIPPSLDLHLDENDGVGSTLIDKHGAICGSVLLLVTLVVLVSTSTVGVPVWEVTVPPAIVMLLHDFYHDWSKYRSMPRQRSEPRQTEEQQTSAELANEGLSESTELVDLLTQSLSPGSVTAARTLYSVFSRERERVTAIFPTVTVIAKRLPYPLLPFAFLMFIQVQGLATKGWLELLAGWWAAWIRKTGTLGAVGGMGFIACMFCNICSTNIGATIVLARVIQIWTSNNNDLDPRTRDGAIYALALGSNYGAFTLTFSASLAGLLWRQILHQKGIRIRSLQFLRLNLPIAFTAMLSSLAVLVGQLYVIYGH
ncbi:hypothetical protein CERSUDRAFT_101113 [Gelatoporia subvermispora B]|uniref:Citrate transporter-like domain-containing protein n=1 Tax=Ceriporiopsis subvermispora (strain B) TaxID=914234 RepID=M2QVY0_CERS8|nr:hypothetical protein CERSUDRAFT_101113 [Gelatoporia subvermispora B]